MKKDKKEKKKKELTPVEKKSVLTTFILLFPTMLITILTTRPTSIFISVFALALFVFQAILIKNFVKDHYAIA